MALRRIVQPRLLVYSTETTGRGRTFKIDEMVTVVPLEHNDSKNIGLEEEGHDNHIVIQRNRFTEPLLSPKHFKFFLIQGKAFVSDRGSPQGTSVNGLPVKSDMTLLKHGDVITPGQHDITRNPIVGIVFDARGNLYSRPKDVDSLLIHMSSTIRHFKKK